MPKFATRSTYTFAFLAVWALVVLCGLIISYAGVMEQRTTHWSVDGPGVVGYFFNIALLGMGGFVLTGLALTELVLRASNWWKATLAVALAAGLANLANSFIFLGERGWVILYRDLVAVAISGVLIAVLAAWLSRFLSKRGAGTLLIVLVSGGATILLVPVLMLILLLVHCTSGDCL